MHLHSWSMSQPAILVYRSVIIQFESGSISCWCFQPICKICSSNWEAFPQFEGRIFQEFLKAPSGYSIFNLRKLRIFDPHFDETSRWFSNIDSTGREKSPTEKPQKTTLPETNSKFAPENGWLEYFLVSFWGVGLPIFRGKLAVSLLECNKSSSPEHWICWFKSHHRIHKTNGTVHLYRLIDPIKKSTSHGSLNIRVRVPSPWKKTWGFHAFHFLKKNSLVVSNPFEKICSSDFFFISPVVKIKKIF